MKKNAIILLVIFISLFFIGCNKDSEDSEQPNTFMEDLHAKDAEKANAQIQTLLKPYSETNMQSFANSLSARYPLTIVIICYDCVLTIPRFTEIKIEYTYSGVKEQRYLDILPDRNKKMYLAAVHE